jgi:hypothetical protein
VAAALVLAVFGLGVVGSAAAAQQSSSNCVTTAPVVLELLNPHAGDALPPGASIVMNGIAYDPSATQGTGIDKITIYLDNRDQGGLFLGQATQGQPNPQAPANSEFANAGFTLKSNSLPNVNSAHTIYVYAHDAQNNKETVLQVPVWVGNSAPTAVPGITPTPVPPRPVVCTPGPAETTAPAGEPTQAIPSLPTSTPTTAATLPPVPTTGPAAVSPAAATSPAPIVPVQPVASPVSAVASPAATTAGTAPRGGGIPPEFGLPLLILGALVVGGGSLLRARERRAGRNPDEAPPT